MPDNNTSGSTAGAIFLLYKQWYTQGLVPVAPNTYYHYINTGSATGNGAAVDALYGSFHGIIYVDGDLDFTNNNSGTSSDTSLIVKGKVTLEANSTSLGNAGYLANNI